MKAFITIAVLLCCVSGVFAQASPISIEMGLYNDDIKVFFINDFDLTQSGTSPLLFWVRMTNTSNPVMISIKLSIHYNSLTSGDTELANGESRPFQLASGVTTITNRDLFSEQDTYELKEYTVNEDAADELLNTIFATGKLPSGEYSFNVQIEIHDAVSPPADDQLIVVVNNPTTLDLITPGSPADDMEVMEIYTTLPLFQIESDAQEFRIRVCEKLSTNSSPEDVMNNEPRLETSFMTNTFQYPATSAFPLEEGKTYYWHVIATTPSSSGPVELESEIWAFKIADFSQGASAMQQNQVLNYLRLLLGDDAVDKLFDENGEMRDFNSTGIIMKNGRQISPQDLNAIIESFMAGKVKVKDFTVN